MTLVTRWSLGYSYHQKGVIQIHLVHRYASRRAPALCSMIMFRTVLSPDVSTQSVFLYYVRQIYLEGLFLMFCGVHVTHWLSCQTDEINTVFQSKRFLIIISTLYNGLLNKCGLYVFPSFIGLAFGIYRLFTVSNLKCIHAVFAMLWPFQKMLVPRCSTSWSVAKLFGECFILRIFNFGYSKLNCVFHPKHYTWELH